MDPLFLNIERLLRLRNVRQGRTYLVNNGFTDAEARHLLSGEVREVKFTMLVRLGTLFNCTVDELLDWRGGSDGPLAALCKDSTPEISHLLANKSPKEIEEILKRIGKGEV